MITDWDAPTAFWDALTAISTRIPETPNRGLALE